MGRVNATVTSKGIQIQVSSRDLHITACSSVINQTENDLTKLRTTDAILRYLLFAAELIEMVEALYQHSILPASASGEGGTSGPGIDQNELLRTIQSLLDKHLTVAQASMNQVAPLAALPHQARALLKKTITDQLKTILTEEKYEAFGFIPSNAENTSSHVRESEERSDDPMLLLLTEFIDHLRAIILQPTETRGEGKHETWKRTTAAIVENELASLLSIYKHL